MYGMIQRARELAREKHASFHLFDEDRTGMFEHISEVAGLVQEQGGSPEMITAAWLHDIVEDTDVTLAHVADEFGSEVAALVSGLTDPAEFESLPLEERKQRQADRIRELPDDVKRIKLSDQLSNTRRILNRPPTDWAPAKQLIYVQGARKIARECRGLWPELDERFEAAYGAVVRKLDSGKELS